jgi:hypothetical protein
VKSSASAPWGRLGAPKLAALVAILTLAGCGTTRSATTSRQRAASSTRLRIGEGATVEGARRDERIEATLLAFLPSIAGGANDHPEFNMQYAGAELRLTNVGSTAYAGAPASGVTVVSSEGQLSKGARLSEGPCSGSFARELELAPGRSAQGCVPVQVQVVAGAARLRFAPYGARGRQFAEWSLSKPR